MDLNTKNRAVDVGVRAFIFIGRSGCGKGTQAKFLMEHLKAQTGKETLYIQTGGELRDFIKEDSYTANLVRKDYEAGGLMSEFMTVHMWARVLVKKFTGHEHLVFDGSPRKFHEAGVLDSVFGFYGISDAAKPMIVHIDISRGEAMKRLIARQRMDDTEVEINKRLDWFETDVMPAVGFYLNNPKYNYVKIDGQASPEAIFADLVAHLKI